MGPEDKTAKPAKIIILFILNLLLVSMPSLAEEPKCEDYTDIEEIEILINKTHTISHVSTAANTRVKLYKVENYVWKLCKKPEDCSYVFYFNRDHQDFKINKCKVKHEGKYIECPRERMREYADAWVVPFPSCEKNDVLEIEVVWETTFPMEDAFWSLNDVFFDDTDPLLEVDLTVKGILSKYHRHQTPPTFNH